MSESDDKGMAKALIEADLKRFYIGLTDLSFTETLPSAYNKHDWYIRGNFQSELGGRDFAYELDINTKEISYRSINVHIRQD
jgi:hypothetical protein